MIATCIGLPKITCQIFSNLYFGYLFGGAVEYLGPVNLDVSLISLYSLKKKYNKTKIKNIHNYIKIILNKNIYTYYLSKVKPIDTAWYIAGILLILL